MSTSSSTEPARPPVSCRRFLQIGAAGAVVIGGGAAGVTLLGNSATANLHPSALEHR